MEEGETYRVRWEERGGGHMGKVGGGEEGMEVRWRGGEPGIVRTVARGGNDGK